MAHSTNSSAFKMPLAPPPQPFQSETLLFNDILEEKTLALRDNLREFLQVFSYRKFDLEFSNFLKHTKQMIQEGQRVGANNSRIANSSHLIPMYSRPSGLNFRPPTTLSMINSTRNSTFRFPENNFQPIESSNPFKPPDNYIFQPQVVLPRVVLPQLEQSNHIYRESPISATVIEVSQCTNVTTKTKNDRQSPELEQRPQSTVPNSYSEVTLIENKAASDSQHSEYVDDGSNSIESILDNIGFKIVVGYPNNNEKTSNTSNQHDNQLIVEKYLSMWSITGKIIKSNSKSSIVILSGTLLGDDKITVLENRHDAGVLENRKSNNLVKTTKGLYRLIGHLVGGSPNELYSACLAVHGIPRTWKHILKQLTEKTNKNAMLNFSLESPAGPTKTTVNHKMNVMLKNGSIHTKNMNLTSHKNSGKRKYTEYDKTENNRFLQQSSSLLTSTPKRRKKQLTMFDVPSQILKNKFHENICNKAQSQTPKTINDSIKVTKKRQSDSKKRSSEFLKPNTLVKTLSSNNNSTKQSEQKSSVKNSMNTSMTTRSRSRLLETSFATFKENIVNKSKQAASERLASMSNSKTVNTKQKENIVNCALSSREVKKKGREKPIVEPSLVKEKTKNLKTTAKKNTSQENKTKKKVIRKYSNDCLVVQRTDLFECLETSGDNDDDGSSYNYNVMESPGKISLVSRSDKSRSKTPLMFNLEMNTTTTKSLVISEPPTPLSKSREAKALKRVKAPKITLKEEMKNNRINNKQRIDCQTACKQINDMLEHGSSYDEYGN